MGLIDIILMLVFVVGPFVVALSLGSIIERLGLKKLEANEQQFNDVLVTNIRRLPAEVKVETSALCIGSVVVAPDLVRTFFAGFKMIFGGEVRSLQRVYDRGRREAIVRMKKHAASMGCDMVINLRIDTVAVGLSNNNQQYPVVQVLAYGTAIRRAR